MTEVNDQSVEGINSFNMDPQDIKEERFSDDNINFEDFNYDVKIEIDIEENEIKLEDYYNIEKIDTTNYSSETKPNFCKFCNFEDEKTESKNGENINLYCNNCYKNDFNKYNIIWQRDIYNVCDKCDHCTKAFKNGYCIKKHNCCNLVWCKICRVVFDKKNKSVLHYKRYKNKCQSYICYVCCKSHQFVNELKCHKVNHSGKKLYYCNDCSRSFNQKSILIIHSRIHSGENPYSCNICSKSFSRSNHLKDHKYIHSGEKPYSCNICSKSFTRSCDLNAHNRIHSVEKPYSCNICSKSFTRSSNLNAHNRIHSGEKPYLCNICSKSFSQSHHLKEHKQIHSGEKPYLCNICSKSFTRYRNLTVHKLTHSVEKPFACNECFKSFYYKTSLVRHLRSH